MLIAHQKSGLPLDLQDQADRWWKLADIDEIISAFRLRVADVANEFVSVKPDHEKLLERLSCGDPAAENEATTLADHFLDTDGYQRTLLGGPACRIKDAELSQPFRETGPHFGGRFLTRHSARLLPAHWRLAIAIQEFDDLLPCLFPFLS